MSDQTTPMTAVSPEQPPPASRKGRGGVIAVAASVVAVLAIAGGGYAAWQFFAGSGARPAEVLPASTFAMVAVDLDPTGGQKIEAIKTLRKLPTFREETGLKPDSDVIKAIWEETLAKECKDVDYGQDIKPWIGQRAALGGVELDKGKPLPVMALQMSDADAAQKGMTKLTACAKDSGDDDFGFTLGEDYVIVSDSTAHAKSIAAAGEKSPLAEDASYQKWTEEAGGPGILNGYVSQRGGQVFRDEIGGDLEEAGADATKQLDKALKAFKGAGATLRFNDGGLEMAFAGGGDTSKVGTTSVGDHVDALPKDTAALIAGAVDGDKLSGQIEEAIKGFSDTFGGLSGTDGQDPLDVLEQQTGLRLPEDLISVLGDSFSVSIGGDAPADLDAVQEPSELPLGYLVRGDDAAVKDVVDRVEQRSGVRLEDLPATFDSGDGKAVLATSPDYAQELLTKGSLGDDDAFKDVVPHADKSPFVLYLSLENGWSQALAKSARDNAGKDGAEIAGDIEALRALGLSAWTEGSTAHALVRLTLK